MYPVLSHFDPDLPVTLVTDATIVGVGAVLMQNAPDGERTVAFASKALSRAQRNYGVTQLELYAIVFAVEKFSYYLDTNRSFRVITDHSAIGSLLRTRDLTGRLARWVIRLSEYDVVRRSST